MQTVSSTKPDKITINDLKNGKSEIILVPQDSIIEISDEEFVYDMYMATVESRPGLKKIIKDNFNAWVNKMKEIEADSIKPVRVEPVPSPEPEISIEERLEATESALIALMEVL